MVEEFMLLANISVAQKIYEEFSECALLRKHPAPPPSNYDILIKAAKSKVRVKSTSYPVLMQHPEPLILISGSQQLSQCAHCCRFYSKKFHRDLYGI